MYCLDTNIIIDIFKGDKTLGLKLGELTDDSTNIFLTPITLCELYKGAYTFFNSKDEINKIDSFISSFALLEFNQDACKIFGETYAKLKKAGKMTKELDLMIASIAKAHSLTLVTRDKEHFSNIGLKIEEW